MARLPPNRENVFPLLVQEGYDVTSVESWIYNCVAFAADDDGRWWWPDHNGIGFWPAGIPREVKIEVFIDAFETIGYEVCADGGLEVGYEKIAIYEHNGTPTHAAKQTPLGRWKSKLGSWEDIEHNTLRGVESWAGSGTYGKATRYMRRRTA